MATLVLLPVALIGSRLLHVASHWSEYRLEPGRIMDRTSGGMAMYGGLLLMLPASVPVLAAIGVPFWRFWDVSIFLILLAMVLTRVGCLLNGCCTGRITEGPFGLHLRDAAGEWACRVPTQLLEGLLAVVLLAAAVAVWRGLERPGELFLLVLAGYGAGRCALQPLRAERGRLDGMLLLSLALVVLAVAGLVILRT